MMKWMLVAGWCAGAAFGQAPFDPRLSAHTILREDVFAGFMANDEARLARGEKNLELLMAANRPERPALFGWKGDIALYRAVTAYEGKREDEFKRQLKMAEDAFTEARRLGPEDTGVAAVSGGGLLLFADRLPEQYRAMAYQKAYEAYQVLWKAQGASVEHLPLHIKGELLAGMTQMAQRTGRTGEYKENLDRIIALMPDTPYAARAKKWKEDPQLAARSAIGCQSCHEPGRLAARTAALGK
jgi:hypothetical protein